MRPSTSPGSTCSPSFLRISASVPLAGAATSMFTLSVLISRRGSFSATASPTDLNHVDTTDSVPSDCPTGTVTSTRFGIVVSLRFEDFGHPRRDRIDSRHNGIHQVEVVWDWNVGHRETVDRGVEIEERFLRDS